jgi:flagellar motor switch protein FliM
MATLNDEEVEALMSAIQEGQVQASAYGRARGAVVPYDLTSQDRITRGELPGLDAINERAAGIFASGLSGRTRLDLRVTSAPSALMKFSELTPLLAPPATVCVVTMGGAGNEQGLTVLESGLAETLLAAALGDRKARTEATDGNPRRELTSVERLVLRRLVGVLCDALGEAWSEVFPFKLDVLRFENDPRLCVVAPPNDVAILTPFEISGALSGRIQLAVPYSAVEPVRKHLASPPRTGGTSDGRFGRVLADELERVPVELCALLGRTSLRLERLLQLEVGDVLTLQSGESEPLSVLVEGREKMRAAPMAKGSSLAVSITEVLPPPDLSGPRSPLALPAAQAAQAPSLPSGSAGSAAMLPGGATGPRSPGIPR